MTVFPVAATVVGLWAQSAPPGSDRGEEFGKTSPIALVVILLLGLATALLIRSMNKRLRNVPESFDTPADPDDDASGGAADDPAAAGDDTAAPGRRTGTDPPGR